MNKRITYIDTVRVVACFTVIGIHSIACLNGWNSKVWAGWDSLSMIETSILRVMTSLCRVCIPLFVMVTGALMLDKSRDLSVKKIMTSIRRFVLCMLVFLPAHLIIGIAYYGDTISPEAIFSDALSRLMSGHVGVYWYLIMLIGLYLLLPFIQKAVNGLDDKMLYFTTIALFILSSVLPYVKAFVSFYNFFPEVSVFVLYLLLGYLISHDKLKLKNTQCVLIIISVIVLYFIFCFIPYFDYGAEIYGIGGDLGTVNPFVILLGVAIFSLIKNLSNPNGGKIIGALAPFTFGVYLISPWVLDVLQWKFSIPVSGKWWILWLFIVFILAFCVSAFITYLLRKIPFVRRYFV